MAEVTPAQVLDQCVQLAEECNKNMRKVEDIRLAMLGTIDKSTEAQATANNAMETVKALSGVVPDKIVYRDDLEPYATTTAVDETLTAFAKTVEVEERLAGYSEVEHTHAPQIDIAGNAATATMAAQAEKDGAGNIISETYVTEQWLQEHEYAQTGDYTTMQGNIANLTSQVLNLSKKVTKFELWAIDNGYTA